MDRIKLPEEMCTYLESLMYEVNARKDLCAFMIDKGITGEAFEKYHTEYIEQNAKYSVAKDEVSKYLMEQGINNVTWNLDFTTGEAVLS